MVQAYILIQTEVGKAAAVAREISGMKGVTLSE
ncbi:MAG: Lrp/AsnC family transcriptional regulator, partial [Acidothermaceae bacterium]